MYLWSVVLCQTGCRLAYIYLLGSAVLLVEWIGTLDEMKSTYGIATAARLLLHASSSVTYYSICLVSLDDPRTRHGFETWNQEAWVAYEESERHMRLGSRTTPGLLCLHHWELVVLVTSFLNIFLAFFFSFPTLLGPVLLRRVLGYIILWALYVLFFLLLSSCFMDSFVFGFVFGCRQLAGRW